MFNIKLLLIVVVLAAGVMLGMNMANNRPLLSNPFHQPTAREQAKAAMQSAVKEGKAALREQLDK